MAGEMAEREPKTVRKGPKVVLGVTGGIGAYRAPELVRALKKRGCRVQVVLTRAARAFVSPLALATVSGEPVLEHLFEPPAPGEGDGEGNGEGDGEGGAAGYGAGAPSGDPADIRHISLTEETDLFLVAPATAHAIARLALGLADDFLTTFALACRAPLLIAPAMNTNMLEHPATAAHLETLRARGARILPPGRGELACGWMGPGRLPDNETLVAAVEEALGETLGETPAEPGAAATGAVALPAPGAARAETPAAEDSGDDDEDHLDSGALEAGDPDSGDLDSGDLDSGARDRQGEAPAGSPIAKEAAAASGPLAGRRVLIVAGPTREPLDPVRFLSNRSSGRMGFALAREARARGAAVTLVLGPGTGTPPAGCRVRPVETAVEMHREVLRESPACDAVVLAAAVADYRPAAPSPEKLKSGPQRPAAGTPNAGSGNAGSGNDGAGQGGSGNGGAPVLTLIPNPDILADLGARRAEGAAAGEPARPPVLIGFAAETGDPEAEAARKLDAKRCDLIVGNRVGGDRVFDRERTEAVLVERRPEGPPRRTRRPPETKARLAAAIWTVAARRLSEAEPGPDAGDDPA